MSIVAFEDAFVANEVDPGGKKFDNVSRVVGTAESYDLSLTIDVQSELFRIRTKDRFTMALAKTINLDGSPSDATYDQSGRPTLLDKYDYGMYGKIFRYEYVGDHQVAVYVSYGGLLMKLQGDQRHLSTLVLDESVYCLLRKIVD